MSSPKFDGKGTWTVHYRDGRKKVVSWEVHYDPTTNTTYVWTGSRWHIHVGEPGFSVVANHRTVPRPA